MLAHLVAVIHVISLPLGVAVLVLRARALAQAESPEGLKKVFLWDNHYAGIALIWIGSGLLRAFAGFEKGTDYYLSNHAFWTKMLLLAVVLGAESVPMATFIRWRVQRGRGQPISFEKKARLLRLHWVELWAIVAMVAMAVLMSRGVGVMPPKASTLVHAPAVDAARGASIYQMRCVTCHQADGHGLGGKLAGDLAERLVKPDAVLVTSVANGVPNTAMRGFAGELSDADIRDVVRYVRERYGKAGKP